MNSTQNFTVILVYQYSGSFTLFVKNFTLFHKNHIFCAFLCRKETTLVFEVFLPKILLERADFQLKPKKRVVRCILVLLEQCDDSNNFLCVFQAFSCRKLREIFIFCLQNESNICKKLFSPL